MRILFVAMPNSVHVARWINQISDRGWDLHLFASTPELVHPDFRNITIYGFSSFRPKGLDPSVRLRGVWPLRRGYSLIRHLALGYPVVFQRFVPWRLAGVIRYVKQDFVHSIETQHAG